LTASTQYYYRVRAYNVAGQSDYSNVDGAETEPEPPFGFKEGDFWEFAWDYYHNSWAQGSGSSTTEDAGKFSVTLGAPTDIDGITAYEVHVSGNAGEFAPRWQYLAYTDGVIYGSLQGLTLQTIFDPVTRAWLGGGFFAALDADSLVVAEDGYITNDYISGPAIETGNSSSQSQCEYYYNTFSDCGSGYCSGATWCHHVGLVASSFTGDAPGELEPNDSPDTAQGISVPGAIDGEASTGGAYIVWTYVLSESEPNDAPTTPLLLLEPVGATLLFGSASDTDTFNEHSFQYQGVEYSTNGYDWYMFTLGRELAQHELELMLSFTDATNADLDLYLFDSSGTTLLAYSDKDNIYEGDPTESTEANLVPGTYLICINAYDTAGKSVDYMLILKDRELTVYAEDWYSFVLAETTGVTITLDFQASPSADLDLYLLDGTGMITVASSADDNSVTGNPVETITATLDPGTYYIAIDAYAIPDGAAEYTVQIE